MLSPTNPSVAVPVDASKIPDISRFRPKGRQVKPCLERLETRVLLASSTPWPVLVETATSSGAYVAPTPQEIALRNLAYQAYGAAPVSDTQAESPQHFQFVFGNGQTFGSHPTGPGPIVGGEGGWRRQIASWLESHAPLSSVVAATTNNTMPLPEPAIARPWDSSGEMSPAAGWSGPGASWSSVGSASASSPSPASATASTSAGNPYGPGLDPTTYLTGSGWVTFKGSVDPTHPERDFRFAFGPGVEYVQFMAGPQNPIPNSPFLFKMEADTSQGAYPGQPTTQPGSGPGLTFEELGLNNLELSSQKGLPPWATVKISLPPGMSGTSETIPNSTDSSVGNSAQNATPAAGTSTDFVLYVYVGTQAPLNSPEFANAPAFVPWENNSPATQPGQPSGASPSNEMPSNQAMEEETAHPETESASASMEWQPGSVLVATGPLPSRTAAPLGGVLAKGDPVPLVDSRDAAVIDLALLDLMGARDVDSDDQTVISVTDPSGAGSTTHEPEDGGLAGRGLGGLPLLGSSMTDFSRSIRKRDLPRIDETEPDVTKPRSGAQSPPQGSSLDPLVTEPVSDSGVQPQPMSGRRISALAGLSIMAAFTVGLVLPEFSGKRLRRFRTWSRIRRFLRGSGGEPSGGQ